PPPARDTHPAGDAEVPDHRPLRGCHSECSMTRGQSPGQGFGDAGPRPFRQSAGRTNGAAPPVRFKLVPFDRITVEKTRPYLIREVIPREGIVLIWGSPKSGKSFWALDAVLHVALGWEYRGRRVSPGGVVYVACEGERGLGARI